MSVDIYGMRFDPREAEGVYLGIGRTALVSSDPDSLQQITSTLRDEFHQVRGLDRLSAPTRTFLQAVGTYINTAAEGSPVFGIFTPVLAGDRNDVAKLVEIGYQVLATPLALRDQIVFEQQRNTRHTEQETLFGATGRFAAAKNINPRVTHRR